MTLLKRFTVKPNKLGEFVSCLKNIVSPLVLSLCLSLTSNLSLAEHVTKEKTHEEEASLNSFAIFTVVLGAFGAMIFAVNHNGLLPHDMLNPLVGNDHQRGVFGLYDGEGNWDWTANFFDSAWND